MDKSDDIQRNVDVQDLDLNQRDIDSTTLNSRRNFLKKSVLGMGTIALPQMPLFAGPFMYDENGHLIPEDKKLAAHWVKSLYERGIPETYTNKKNQLKYIGMPVGGVACGQLYLSGDGRLWFWHIFKTEYTREKDHNQRMKAMTLGSHYAFPDEVFERETRPVEQGAAIRLTVGGKSITRELNDKGFKDISFRGEYPIGKVTYKDAALPVEVYLEAFSPFIPLEPEKSALPVTIMSYKVKNTSDVTVEVELGSWLENAVCAFSNNNSLGQRRNTLITNDNRKTIYSTVEGLATTSSKSVNEDIVFEDFESGSYKRWKVKGEAFGDKAVKKGEKGFFEENTKDSYFVSSFNVRNLNGEPNNSTYRWGRITPAHAHIGTLTSKKFTITHDYITFLIGGGYHPGKNAINLIVDGVVKRSVTADNNTRLKEKYFDVRDFAGKKARLEIVDNHKGMWGSIAVDHIVFTDQRPMGAELDQQHGYGSMSWSLYRPTKRSKAVMNIGGDHGADQILDKLASTGSQTSSTSSMDHAQVGALGETFALKPGEEREVTFILTWYFPFLNQLEKGSGELHNLKDIQFLNKHYHNWFRSANQVADYVTKEFDALAGTTRLWNKTYYDSTLPYWLLDRSFISINCLATNTMLWFDNGRIWGWEGVECCQGTCQHVWQYAQGMARIFPQMEKTLREKTDLGYALKPNGGMGHRDETASIEVAHDGHCGTIMRMYREHKTSSDYEFLKRNYQKIKSTIRFMINEDKDKDGILEGKQQNTLDAAWYGPMGWISSLYIGALAAGEEMALEMGDDSFAKECSGLLKKGRENIVKLFNGEYFIHIPDRENHPQTINSNDGCHIDQVLGQSFGWQVGLPTRITPEKETISALESIWKYNFAPDAFAYQEQHKIIKGVRIYATEGEAGTIMTTWPKSDGDTTAVPGMATRSAKSDLWGGPGAYFDEVWPGQEYQVASHMIWEGMLEKGLATAKAVHDRYNPIKRNPYNEIECSDHYSRSMASYGVFLALCGFDYHGPKGELSFAPKLNPEKFKAPFTTAQGWGSFTQHRRNDEQVNTLELKYGQLNLKQLSFVVSEGKKPTKAVLMLNDKNVNAEWSEVNGKLVWSFDGELLGVGDEIESLIRF